MFRLTRPTSQDIEAFVAAQSAHSFSYAEVGATRDTPPSGYTIDHNRVRLGSGAATFDRASAALREWCMTSVGWSTVYPRTAPIEAGTDVAAVTRHFGFWSMNACRIVYVLDEADSVHGDVRRAGFAYGTLVDHGERGEERFTVDWQRSDDSVWYDLFAFSRPAHPLAQLGYPLARHLQRRFAIYSKRAMIYATRGDATGAGGAP